MAKKSKKQGTKTKKSVKRAPRKQVVDTKGSMSFAMGVCSLTNPFCPESVNSRWPDNSYTKSVGWSVTNMPQQLSANAAGDVNVLLFPEGYYSLGTLTGNSSANGALTAFTTWPTGTVRYRITSWGVRVSCQMTPMTASGMVRVRLFSPMGGTSLATTSIVSNLADASIDIPLARLINEDLFVIPAPLGDNARFFRDTADFTTTLANYKNPGWQIVQLAINGAPASTTNALVFNIFYNLEFVFGDGDASMQFATPPPRNSPALQQGSASVIETVGNFLEGTAEKVDRIFKSKAFRLGTNMAAMAGAAYTGNPKPLLAIRNMD
jgi:hypothetical protein